MTQILPPVDHGALTSLGFAVMAGAVVAAEMLIFGEEIMHRLAMGLPWR